MRSRPALMLPSGEQDEANFAAVHDLNPLRRGVEVGDVVAALRFLIDSPAMTGQTLVLDGGQRFMGLPRDVQFLRGEPEMSDEAVKLQGMVPDHLKVRQSRILLDSLEVMTDIGFHEFEVGNAAAAADHGRAVARGSRPAGRRRSSLRLELRLSRRRGDPHCPGAALQPPGNAGSRDFSAGCRLSRSEGAAGEERQAGHLSDAKGVGVEIASFAGETP